MKAKVHNWRAEDNRYTITRIHTNKHTHTHTQTYSNGFDSKWINDYNLCLYKHYIEILAQAIIQNKPTVIGAQHTSSVN